MHTDEIVRVHNSVDETVQADGQVDVPVIVDARVEPVKEKNRGVVVHVKETQLLVLLAYRSREGRKMKVKEEKRSVRKYSNTTTI